MRRRENDKTENLLWFEKLFVCGRWRNNSKWKLCWISIWSHHHHYHQLLIKKELNEKKMLEAWWPGNIFEMTFTLPSAFLLSFKSLFFLCCVCLNIIKMTFVFMHSLTNITEKGVSTFIDFSGGRVDSEKTMKTVWFMVSYSWETLLQI